MVNGHVTALQLQNNSLIGTVPEDIGDLPELTQLDLRQNSLISLPDAIGSLPNLLTLNMRLNLLTTLPDGIA